MGDSGALEGAGYGGFFVQTLLVLLLLGVASFVLVRYGLRRGLRSAGPLRVLARLPLEPRRTLFIVDAAGKTLLIGTSEGGPMTVLGELDGAAVRDALAGEPPARSFAELVKDALGRASGGGRGTPG